jgi:hypothetical protein
MAGIKIKSGHAVTSTLPPNADGAQVAPANIQFHAGGGYTDSMAKKKASGFPPAK